MFYNYSIQQKQLNAQIINETKPMTLLTTHKHTMRLMTTFMFESASYAVKNAPVWCL